MWLRVSLVIAGSIVVVALSYAWYDHNFAYRWAQKQLRVLKERNKLPPEFQGVDIDAVDFSEHQLTVPPWVLLRHSVANALVVKSYVWIPIVVVLCVGVAWLVQLFVGKD